METKKVLLFGGLAIGGYLLYKRYKDQQLVSAASHAAASAPPSVASTLTDPINIPTSGFIAPGQNNLPSGPAFAPAKTIPQNVTDWINSMNDPGKTSWANAVNSWFTQQDVYNLSDAIGYFASNTLMPGGLNSWWNAIAAKVG